MSNERFRILEKNMAEAIETAIRLKVDVKMRDLKMDEIDRKLKGNSDRDRIYIVREIETYAHIYD